MKINAADLIEISFLKIKDFWHCFFAIHHDFISTHINLLFSLTQQIAF